MKHLGFNTAVNACGRVGGLWPRASTLLQALYRRPQLPDVASGRGLDIFFESFESGGI